MTTIHLPLKPKFGQHYEILKGTTNELQIQGDSHDIWSLKNGIAASHGFGVDIVRVFLDYVDDVWILTWAVM